MRIKQSVIAISALALASCATTAATPMLDADGEPIWVISCNSGQSILSDGDGLSSLWQQPGVQACFRKAEEICPSGYRLVSADQDAGAASGGAYTDSLGDVRASYRQGVERTVIVRCEAGATSPPT